MPVLGGRPGQINRQREREREDGSHRTRSCCYSPPAPSCSCSWCCRGSRGSRPCWSNRRCRRLGLCRVQNSHWWWMLGWSCSCPPPRVWIRCYPFCCWSLRGGGGSAIWLEGCFCKSGVDGMFLFIYVNPGRKGRDGGLGEKMEIMKTKRSKT